MIVAAVVAYSILIFPFLITVKAKYAQKNIGLVFLLFNLIPIFNLKIKFTVSAIEICRGKKINTVKYTELLSFEKGVKPFLDLHFTKVVLDIKTGSEDIFYPFLEATALTVINDTVNNVLFYEKPHLKTYVNTNIYLGENFTELTLKINLLINALTVLINGIKFLIGKIVK